ncbi:glycosyltransferase family 2 protein [Leeuwenhoekiella sp. ZYFB001]|uniref:glycosyltransferase family 2 protein n=1 Tax=Leeuwenhoekiella sp. ZYFB001 TaxID=2719912 RepID=UPI001430B16D|nr:glycosyltransferase family 2 protein [Leeuwenhoekiella sp. ZYFB001]
MKKISIVIPTLNRSNLISKTLLSIQQQSFSNWECIIVDDESHDNTKDVVSAFVSSDPRFKYYLRPKHLEKGPSSCRNYGYSRSTGDYINWFDDDDIMLQDALSLRMEAFELDTDCVVCPLTHWNFDLQKSLGITTVTSNDLISEYLIGRVIFFVSGPIWKKSFLEKQPELFDPDIRNLDDWDFNLRMLYSNPKISFVDRPLILYRIHSNTLSQKLLLKDEIEIDSLHRTRIKHLKILNKLNIEDLRFKRLVKREIKSNILWVFINKKQWRFKLLQYLLLISYYTKDLNFGIRGGIGFISYFIFGKGYIFFKEYK